MSWTRLTCVLVRQLQLEQAVEGEQMRMSALQGPAQKPYIYSVHMS